ncbi:MAG TPA: hypothetical protein VMU83_17260 [Hanamia sp.]|nr:hypothetical protein [Hanamia sp.]
MHTIERKIHLIEEVLKIDNESILQALEVALEKSKKPKNKKRSIYDFVGVITNEEAKQMKKAIKETAETINADDWK